MLSALFAESSAQHVVVPVEHGFELGGGLSGNIQSERLLTVSFGGAHPARVDRALQLTWPQFAKWLVRSPAAADDKAAAGWYCPTEFAPEYRDSDNFVARHAITFDFDHVETDTWDRVLQAWHSTAYAIYTTFSHTEEKPRFRVVMPLSRPAGYDEFQAVARMVASDIGIELIARESFVPAQMMYAPLRKADDSPHQGFINDGEWLDVDAVLARYVDWTDVGSWPKRQEADGVHTISEEQTPPNEKLGVVGDFCRAFTVGEAIRKFDLPYEPTATEGRWTYTLGSRPEGAIEYDDGLKFHSHHDTDPARGQTNAFDLVRLHKFSDMDAGVTDRTVTDRPSWRAMCDLAGAQPEVQAILAAASFEDLGPLPVEPTVSSDKFHIYNALEFSAGPPMEWIVRDILPRAEMAVVYGESGSGKSFWVLDLCAAVTRGIEWRGKRTKPGKVVYVCAEGAGGFKSRLKAYMQTFEAEQLPAVIPAAPNLLEAKDPALLIETLLAWGKTDVIVIDTLSAATPGGNENAGEDMGKAISHCKAIHAATGALVVLVHHSGKDAAKGARGWSGLKAATDAEIEITRNGQLRCATISKMKDGEDGPTMPFKLTRVLLGFDADGEELSSCVVEHTDEMPELRTKKKLSSKQNTVLNILRIMHVSGTTVDVGDLYDGVRKADPEFKRKRDFDSALAGLVDAGYASLDDGRVGLLGAVAAPDEDWLE